MIRNVLIYNQTALDEIFDVLDYSILLTLSKIIRYDSYYLRLIQTKGLKILERAFETNVRLDKISICLHCANIQHVPQSIHLLTKLQLISFDINNLKILPDTFCELINLKNLSLSNNKLLKLPNNFGNLKNLVYLYLDNNLLSTLPETFYNLDNLQLLWLFNNKFEKQFRNIKQRYSFAKV